MRSLLKIFLATLVAIISITAVAVMVAPQVNARPISTGPVIDITSPVTIMSPATSASPYYTNQSSVQVTGSATDSVPLSSGNWTYYVNGTEVAQGAFANVNGLNDFGVNQTYPLALGNNTVVMMFNDSADNSVVVSMTAIYSTGPVIDITSPVTIMSPATSASPYYTNQSSVQVTGSATDSVPLSSGNWTYYVNGTEVAQGAFANVNGLNDFGVNQTYPLALGNNTVVMMFNDTAGNSVTVSGTIIYDTMKPSIIITTPGAGAWYNTTSLNVTWTASDEGSGIAYCIVYLNGTQVANTTNDHFVLTGLEAGWYNITVKAYDNAGNMNESYMLFNIELASPALTIVAPTGNELFASTPVDASWTSSSASGVLYYWVSVDGGQWVQETGTVLTMNDLAQGANTLSVKVLDAAGNWNEMSVGFVIDTIAPSVSISSPGAGAWYNTTALNVTWKGSDPISGIAYYLVYENGEQVANVTTNYTEVSGLIVGSNTIEVVAYDNAGNMNESTKTFNIELSLTAVSITSPSKNALLDTTSVQVKWTGSSASGISHYRLDVNGRWFNETGNSSASITAVQGVNTVMIQAEDFAGNWKNSTVSFTVDVIPPVISALSPTGTGVAVGTTISVSFSKQMNETSVLLIVNGVTGTTSWRDDTVFFTPSSTLIYATTYHVTVTGKDVAGNELTGTMWNFTTETAGTILGVAQDSSGNPIANATVTLSNGMTTTTDANGNFVFDNVTAGTYNVTISKDGYQTVTQQVTTTVGNTSDLGALSVSSAPSSNDDTVIVVGVIVVLAVLIGAFLLIRQRKK